MEIQHGNFTSSHIHTSNLCLNSLIQISFCSVHFNQVGNLSNKEVIGLKSMNTEDGHAHREAEKSLKTPNEGYG